MSEDALWRKQYSDLIEFSPLSYSEISLAAGDDPSSIAPTNIARVKRQKNPGIETVRRIVEAAGGQLTISLAIPRRIKSLIESGAEFHRTREGVPGCWIEEKPQCQENGRWMWTSEERLYLEAILRAREAFIV